MKIIYASDFSANAELAGMVAANLAIRWKDTVAVCHVLETSFDRDVPKEVRHVFSTFVQNRLHDSASLLHQAGVPVETHLLKGFPDKALSELARQGNVRMTVVSSLGTGSGEWLLGSVAERLVASNSVPTLVVRAADPFSEWVKEKKALKIFVGFDFTETSENALRWIKHLTDIGPCEICIGYIDWPLGERVQLGAGLKPSTESSSQMHIILEREIKDRVKTFLGEVPFKVRAEASTSNPDLRLVEMAKEEKADLLITGTHQRHGIDRVWHPSIAEGILRNAPMSVLCVPSICPTPVPVRHKQIKRVLVAVDLEQNGDRIIPYAYGIAHAGAVVRLVYVTPSFQGNSDDHNVNLRSREEQDFFITDTRKRLNALVPGDAAARGIITESDVIEDFDVPKALRMAADRFGPDLICVGMHNRAGHPYRYLGTVAMELLTRSQHPIMIVRDPSP